MPPRKRRSKSNDTQPKATGYIAGAGQVNTQNITDTLESNYMPYAMSVIVSRAIPEIDGFKPSHRKLLYTMYRMGLLGGKYMKSANIVGETMKLNPHGDAAIYETMVRLTRGNESLLHPLVDSKGAFGSAYSTRDTPAAARYTEARLDEICRVVFGDIEKDTVDFTDNYDGTLKEPTLLPVAFPSILVNNNTGIAVGMASSICSFNLKEICETAAELIKNPNHNLHDTLKAPDFPGGGQIIYNRDELDKIYDTGRGSIKIRAYYTYDKLNNCIDITQIPPTTTIEAITDKTIELVKTGKIKEIADIRDETGIDGLKITIDLKRGADADSVMQRLFRMTPLEDSFSCNFNVLISGYPRVCSVRELLDEWTGFRVECIRRRVHFDLTKAKEKLHLLRGLEKILLDIDKAIYIIRHTEQERDVVPNLMSGFEIDQLQAEYVAEIKLRHLNREYILKRTDDIDELSRQIEQWQSILDSRKKVEQIIIKELKEIAEKYGQPRRSSLIFVSDEPVVSEETPSYPVHVFMTKEGYFKKVTPQSLRMSGEHKLKENDIITQHIETFNNADLLFFTDKYQVYKAKADDFADSKVSLLGDYIPAKLNMEEGENVIYMEATTDYSGTILFFFENGKCAKTDMSAYATKTNRKKLANAYSDKCGKCVSVIALSNDSEIAVKSSAGKLILFDSSAIASKSKGAQGVQVLSLKKNQYLASAVVCSDGMFIKPAYYRVKTLPSVGKNLRSEDIAEQISMI